jgi:hypothetical protein
MVLMVWLVKRRADGAQNWWATPADVVPHQFAHFGRGFCCPLNCPEWPESTPSLPLVVMNDVPHSGR